MTQARFLPATPPEIALIQAITAWTYAEATRRMADPSRPNTLRDEAHSGIDEAISLLTALHWITPDPADSHLYHIATTRPGLPPNLKRIDLDSALHAFARMADVEGQKELQKPEEAGRRRTMPDEANEIRALGPIGAVSGRGWPCLALSLK